MTVTHRTSFAGALLVMAIGAVLAFAVQGSPRYLDIHATGLILALGAAADLAIRALIADSPLLSPESADVAAVVEPLGEPVLDAAGNPVVVPNPGSPMARPPLIAPPPGTLPPGSPVETLVITDEPYYPAETPGATAAAAASPHVPGAVTAPASPESPVAVTTITGRPVRPRRNVAGSRRWGRRG
ncbi:hypothetical protein [Actinospica robiniae]|uniref:hypothetical protein n=1 Tax=Actinospica robiniae TaxID=304901 RepID=UPI0012FA31A1|nr:hypothetical protein [Actinospica robiniae]